MMKNSLLQDLRSRLTALPGTGTPVVTFCIPLTVGEIDTLNGALRGFISLVGTFIPQSSARDEALRAFEGLVQQLERMLLL